MPARFQEHGVKTGLKEKRLLSAFLDSRVAVYCPEMKKAQLDYVFCTDEYLLQMNQRFLNHDTLTDIITFDLSDDSDRIVGEIYISYERVRENSAKFGVIAHDELLRVVCHGMLHLCGFKDKKKEDSKVMRMKEDECIAAYKKYRTTYATGNII